MDEIEKKARELLAAECAKTTDSSEAVVRAILLAYPEVLGAIKSSIVGALIDPEPTQEIVEELAYLIDDMNKAGSVTADIGIAAYRLIAAALRFAQVPEPKFPDDGNGDDDAYNAGWNACRAAMLAAAPKAGEVDGG